jgi:hypothetical protein
VESGVREAAYQLGDDLDFLNLHRSRSEPLWPFDFTVQVTFETPPRDADAPEDDKHPFEFPALKPHIHQAVAKLITSGSSSAAMNAPKVLADLREFAVLQRLFRLALTGHLGTSFPLTRLVDLAKVAPHASPVAVRTLRWNIFSTDQRDELVHAGFSAQLAPLGYEQDFQQFKRDGESCPSIAP